MSHRYVRFCGGRLVFGRFAFVLSQLTDRSAHSADFLAFARSSANVGEHWSHGFLPVLEPLTIAAGAELTLEMDVDDGMLWRWSGAVEPGARFDQCTASGMPSQRAAARLPGG